MTSRIRNVLDEIDVWTSYKGVEGIGQSQKDGKDCILVFISCPVSELSVKIPRKYKGFAVVFQKSGQIDIQ